MWLEFIRCASRSTTGLSSRRLIPSVAPRVADIVTFGRFCLLSSGCSAYSFSSCSSSCGAAGGTSTTQLSRLTAASVRTPSSTATTSTSASGSSSALGNYSATRSSSTSAALASANSSSGATTFGLKKMEVRPVSSLVRQASASFSADGQEAKKRPFLIGVAGGTASGKSTVCDRIIKEVLEADGGRASERQIVALSQDSFYRELSPEESALAECGEFNFDHPDAFDHTLMLKCLKDIQEGKPTEVPVYDMKTNSRVKGEFTQIHPSDVVLLEGILVFYDTAVRDIFDMKLFVDTDADTRLARRVLRDIEDRGRDLEKILKQYTDLVKPAFEEFCLPTKKFADVIIPRGADNTVAIELVAQHIQDIIWARNGQHHTNKVDLKNSDSSCSLGSHGSVASNASTPSSGRSRSNSDSLISR